MDLPNRHLLAVNALTRAYNIVHSLNSRLDDFFASNMKPQEPGSPPDPEEVAHLIHEWHIQEATGLTLRLKIMRLFPFFFSPHPPGTQFRDIDARPIIVCLKDITELSDMRYPGSSKAGANVTPYQLWDSGGPSRLLSVVVSAHLDSFSSHSKHSASRQPKRMMSSWSGVCVVVGMYLTSVLGVWNKGVPAEPRLFRHILQILRRDLQTSSGNLMRRKQTALRDLWFWKQFVGAFSLAHAQSRAYDARLEGLAEEFHDRIRTWAKITGINRWEQARKVLASVVWPVHFPQEDLAESLWAQAIGGQRTNGQQ